MEFFKIEYNAHKQTNFFEKILKNWFCKAWTILRQDAKTTGGIGKFSQVYTVISVLLVSLF